MKKSNLHTHTVFCDGRDTVRHMADRAYSKGFVSLGFSGHGKQTCNPFGISDEHAYAREDKHALLHCGVCLIRFICRAKRLHKATPRKARIYIFPNLFFSLSLLQKRVLTDFVRF